ncbi:hopanoid biosynthesis-associated protein HpnK [Iningainema tapete]|uniref:Hopanoid biosynthesis-associated protein HpnK n=1 Tax=Iningainema tapete BLCC-T55 TaxID=2748662 RepID=A0A8J7CBP2_9CYAN|nr:hopanoid biosynthesis-associated protein HpnK [Iningainema tapete]MBD2771870.1 hopanoid biosynthesis-associated protein HpnK [Iningainema tapete BLCC-T55]
MKEKRALPLRRRFVIINGDDFGFSKGVNQGIITAYEQGVLTSTSLMVTGEAFDEAVALAKSHPNLAVGLHLVLGSAKSVLPHSQIPHLVDEDGNFSDKLNQAGVRYHLSSKARRELPLEIRAQLEKFRSTGLPLSHVDGHNHMHFNPVVLHTLVNLALEFNIKVIRLPHEELSLTLNIDSKNRLIKTVWYYVFGGLRWYGERLLKSKGIAFSDRVYGTLQTGYMSESYLLGLIPQIKANFVEIYSHPAIAIPGEPSNGPQGSGMLELDALVSHRVREALDQNGFELTNYHNPNISLVL